jgi:hypothetical protein
MWSCNVDDLKDGMIRMLVGFHECTIVAVADDSISCQIPSNLFHSKVKQISLFVGKLIFIYPIILLFLLIYLLILMYYYEIVVKGVRWNILISRAGRNYYECSDYNCCSPIYLYHSSCRVHYYYE